MLKPLFGGKLTDVFTSEGPGSHPGSEAISFSGARQRVIFLFMNGGPSHVDTFDPKPALPNTPGKCPRAFKAKLAGRKGMA